MNRSQAGLTLVELVITVAITGIMASVLGTAIFQMVTVGEYGDARLIATHELQNAAYWLNQDGQTAVSAAVVGQALTLTMADASEVTYSVVARRLRRASSGPTLTMAQNITAADFSVSGRVVTMDLTSAPQGRTGVSEQGTYAVAMRAAP